MGEKIKSVTELANTENASMHTFSFDFGLSGVFQMESHYVLRGVFP